MSSITGLRTLSADEIVGSRDLTLSAATRRVLLSADTLVDTDDSVASKLYVDTHGGGGGGGIETMENIGAGPGLVLGSVVGTNATLRTLKSDGATVDVTTVGGEINFEVETAALVHNDLSGLTSGDPHTQYPLGVGRAGGQTIIGGTGPGDWLTLRSTSHATKGYVHVDELVSQTQISTIVMQCDTFRGYAANDVIVASNLIQSGSRNITFSGGTFSSVIAANVPNCDFSTPPADGQVLTYSSALGKWVPSTPVAPLPPLPPPPPDSLPLETLFAAIESLTQRLALLEEKLATPDDALTFPIVPAKSVVREEGDWEDGDDSSERSSGMVSVVSVVSETAC